METRILMEVEEMINKVREEQGRPFDLRQLTTSCVTNVVMNMLFGHRFDHSDASYQQIISVMHEATYAYSFALQIFPLLRFLPYFQNLVAVNARINQDLTNFMNDNTATCTEVCRPIFIYLSVLSRTLPHYSV